jgi:predicted PurR-regulated permease PerM
VEIVYFTLVAAGLYFFSDWVLDRIEKARGERLANRNIIFFAIILVLALITFKLVDILQPPAAVAPAGQVDGNSQMPLDTHSTPTRN